MSAPPDVIPQWFSAPKYAHPNIKEIMNASCGLVANVYYTPVSVGHTDRFITSSFCAVSMNLTCIIRIT